MNTTAIKPTRTCTNRFKKWTRIGGITIACVLLSYLGATPIMSWIWGIHRPVVEDKSSIILSAQKYGLDIRNITTVRPDAHQPLLQQFQRSLPEAIIFNNRGQHILYKVGDSDCNASLFQFIPALNKDSVYKYASKADLEQTVSYLRDLNGNPLPPDYLDVTADFYIFISWADFTGKLNRDNVKKWQDLAVNNPNARIQVIEVNFDVQKWWPEEAQHRILAGYNS
jgi:hypothetical protein